MSKALDQLHTALVRQGIDPHTSKALSGRNVVTSITHDQSKYASERELDVVARLLAYSVNGRMEIVNNYLNGRTCKSLVARGVLRVQRGD